MSEFDVPAPEELPLAMLLRLARREVEDDDGDVPMPALSALHRRPSEEVFDHAAALVCDSDATLDGFRARLPPWPAGAAGGGGSGRSSDDRVRFHVAAALPALVDLENVEPEAAEALTRLCHDDADTRYYALYAVTREIGGLDVQAVTRLTAELANDPDAQIRAMASAHHEAIREVR